MNLNLWLQRNFIVRRLRQLSFTVRQRLFDSLWMPSFLPRRPLIAPEQETPQSLDEPCTSFSVRLSGRTTFFLSSDPVRFDKTYHEWIAPLTDPSPGATAKEQLETLKKMIGSHSEGQDFFPLPEYLQSVPGNFNDAVALAQRCRLSRQPSIDLLLALTGQEKNEAHVVEPSLLLIYTSTFSADDC